MGDGGEVWHDADDEDAFEDCLEDGTNDDVVVVVAGAPAAAEGPHAGGSGAAAAAAVAVPAAAASCAAPPVTGAAAGQAPPQPEAEPQEPYPLQRWVCRTQTWEDGLIVPCTAGTVIA